jgi:hypothetical protein
MEGGVGHAVCIELDDIGDVVSLVEPGGELRRGELKQGKATIRVIAALIDSWRISYRSVLRVADLRLLRNIQPLRLDTLLLFLRKRYIAGQSAGFPHDKRCRKLYMV